ncbi:hypothetical protein [Pseudalkalibacillus caeni]|uniref:Uncharacterized protein n=1 Tax=Exobacillus caeni TaxID=2574798 RepID=A0A5R9FBN5_9BACL|nr:hypothetical protein [Pseudalkalibacillus caeni]TLS37035.1 hypothetical protein FCL54_10910 [Pseudalkalibacillus caeni]
MRVPPGFNRQYKNGLDEETIQYASKRYHPPSVTARRSFVFGASWPNETIRYHYNFATIFFTDSTRKIVFRILNHMQNQVHTELKSNTWQNVQGIIRSQV